MLRFQLFGGLKIYRDGFELKGFVSRKAQALLVYLVLTRRTHFREALQGLLWGESLQTRAAGNLRVALNNLRQLVPGHLEITRTQAAFRSDQPYWLDVAYFEQQAGQPEIEALQAAVDLYSGDLLEGFMVADSQAFDEWLLAERERLRQVMLQTLHHLADYHTGRGEYRAGIDIAARLLALDPWREEAHRELMRLLSLTGQRSAALSQYEQCRRLLAQELGLEPLEETTTLYAQIKAGNARTANGADASCPQPLALPFHGRESEHARLLDWWKDAQRSAGRLGLVEGEVGLGKTRLVSEVLRYVETRDATVLQGRCYEFGGSVPYQSIADALRPYLGQAPKIAQALRASGWLAELSRLLPELRQTYPGLSTPIPADWETARLRLFEAVARLLKEAAKRSMVVLFLDDLHWADSSTLDLLHYMARQLHTESVWMVGAYRPEEVGLGHPLTRLRQGLSRDHLVNSLALTPLLPAAMAQITRALFGGMEQEKDLGEFLHNESEGNPFILAETISSLQEQGLLSCQPSIGWHWQGAPTAAHLPPSIEDLILQRVGRLSEPAQHLLSLAAAAGRQFDRGLLEIASGLQADRVEACLEEWLSRRLVRLVQERVQPMAGYDFSHDKIRAAVYGVISAAKRQGLHGRLGKALESLHQEQIESVYEALAYHYEQAGHTEKALHYLPLAGVKAAALYANEQAMEYYRHALVLCPALDERCWFIWLQQADLLMLVGRYEEAAAACQQVVAGLNPSWQARAYCSLAQISRIQRDYEAARRYVQESNRAALAANALPGAQALRAQILQAQAQIEREQSNLARAQDLFDEALVLCTQAGDAHGMANCFKGLGDILSASGGYAQACQRYEQALGIFQKMGDLQSAAACLHDMATAAWRLQDYTAARQAALQSLEMSRSICDRQGEASALNGLGLAAIVQADYAEAQRCWQASVAIYRELGLDKRAASGLHNLGISYMDSGDLTAARQCLDQALAINRSVSARRDQALDLGWLGKLHWMLGDHTTAAARLEQALALDGEIGGSEEQDWHTIWRAGVACESGDLQNAWRYLQQAEQSLALGCANLKAWDVSQWRAAIYLAEGHPEAALQAAKQALALFHSPDASTQGVILALLGRIYSHLSDAQTAHRYFELALAQLPDAAPTIYTRAKVLHHYANFLARMGEAEQAAACQEDAYTILARIGATVWTG